MRLIALLAPTAAFAAAPADAKPRLLSHETEDAWLVAGGAAAAVLAVAGATLAAAHRHGVHRGRPAPQG